MVFKALFFQRVPALFRKEFFELLDKNIDVYLAAGRPSELENMKCFESVSVTRYEHSDIHYYCDDALIIDKSWRRLIKEIKPNVVVITPTPRMISNYFLLAYCKLRKIPIVGWGMGEMPNRSSLKRKFHALLQCSLVRFLDGVVCYSITAKDYYQSLGVKNVAVAHNSIDTDRAIKHLDTVMQYSDAKLAVKANELGIARQKKRLVYLGRIIPSKHLDKLVVAIGGVENVQLVVVGGGEDSYIASIKALAEQCGVDSVFVGHKSDIELAEAMYFSDLFVLPSLGGLAINHAMSFGLPCIVSQGDGTEIDLVTDGVNGYVFNSGDFEDMGSCIVKALESDSLNAMGQASMKVINDSINLKAMVKSMDDFLKKDLGCLENKNKNGSSPF